MLRALWETLRSDIASLLPSRRIEALEQQMDEMCAERNPSLPLGCTLPRGHEGEHRWKGRVEIDARTSELPRLLGHSPVVSQEWAARLAREGRIRLR